MDNQSPQVNNKKLYVGNLSWNLSEEEIREMFAPFGDIVDVKLIKDFQGRSKGFAFVEYSDEDAAKQAIAELNEKEIDGRQIFVKVAQPKKPRPEGGFRGGDRRGGGRDFNRGNRGFDRNRRDNNNDY